MLDCCPFEVGANNRGYKKIDTKALAYEMIFYDDYGYEDFKNAVKGTNIEKELFQIGKDIRKADYNDRLIRYMMAAPKKGEMTGPEKLMALIENAGVSQTPKVTNDIFGDEDDEEDGFFSDMTDIHLRCEPQEDGTYIIYRTEGRETPIGDLIPCCPNCHNRLPMGWLTADDFMGVSLVAPQGGGKTTYLISMYVDNWCAMNNIGRGVQVIPAHYSANNVRIDSGNTVDDIENKAIDTFHEKRIKASQELKEEGLCPEYTPPSHIITPTFLNVLVEKEEPGEYYSLVVGLYDNSGEVLSKSQARNEKIIMLSNMFAQIYLIEPGQMGMEAEKLDRVTSKSIRGRLLSLEEQGKLQKEHGEQGISGEELLKAAFMTKTEPVGSKKENYKKPMKLLTKLSGDMASLRMPGVFAKQHIAMTIIKCDQLEQWDKIRCIDNHQMLLEQRQVNSEILWDENMQEVNNMNFKEIFDKLVFDGPDGRMNKREFESVKFKSTSWHMISALGTGTEKIPDTTRFRLKGEYDPIRLEEPLSVCIIKKIKENGWLK